MSSVIEYEYLNNSDFSYHISIFCDYKTLVHLALTCSKWYDFLYGELQKRLDEIQWSVIMEYSINIYQKVNIHYSKVILGTVLNSPIDECELCSNKKWYKIQYRSNDYRNESDICCHDNDGNILPSSHINCISVTGCGGSFLKDLIDQTQYVNISSNRLRYIPIVFEIEDINKLNGTIIPKIGYINKQQNEKQPNTIYLTDDASIIIGSTPIFTSKSPSNINISSKFANIKSYSSPSPNMKNKKDELDEISIQFGWKIKEEFWDSFYDIRERNTRVDEKYIYDTPYNYLYDDIYDVFESPPIKRRRVYE